MRTPSAAAACRTFSLSPRSSATRSSNTGAAAGPSLPIASAVVLRTDWCSSCSSARKSSRAGAAAGPMSPIVEAAAPRTDPSSSRSSATRSSSTKATAWPTFPIALTAAARTSQSPSRSNARRSSSAGAEPEPRSNMNASPSFLACVPVSFRRTRAQSTRRQDSSLRFVVFLRPAGPEGVGGGRIVTGGSICARTRTPSPK